MTWTRTAAIVVLVPIVLAIFLQYVLFVNVVQPPLDYGTGSMFDVIASRYDMINRVLSVGMDIGWRKRMVQQIKQSLVMNDNMNDQSSSSSNPSPRRLLDLATGTADVAILLAQEIPWATVNGVDPSHKMLDLGRRKVAAQHLAASSSSRRSGDDESSASRVQLQYADARDLSNLFEEASFDGATMAFGIRNIIDRRQEALCQIHRVLKNHSRFCILEFSEPDDSFGWLGRTARWFIRYVIPFLGGLLSGASREYWHLQNSIKDFPSPQQFGELLSTVDCGAGPGAFQLEDLIHMNYGSVQLYVTRVVKPVAAPHTENESVM